MKRLLAPAIVLFLVASLSRPAIAAGPQGGGGGGGGGVPPVSLNGVCLGSNGGTPTVGESDSCSLTVASGGIPAGATVSIGLSAASNEMMIGCQASSNDTASLSRQSCVFSLLTGVRSGSDLGLVAAYFPDSDAPGPLRLGAFVCQAAGCQSVSLLLSGLGATVLPDPALSVSVSNISAVEGQQFSGTVATYADADQDNRGAFQYSAIINWGDGTSSGGTVGGGDDVAVPAGDAASTSAPTSGFSISGSHTYLEEGTYSVEVSLIDPDTSYNNASGTGQASVADAPLSAVAQLKTTTRSFNGTLATFTDTNPNGALADFSATIDWGDSSTSPASISQGAAGFEIDGNHTYADYGPYTLTVAVCDVGGACAPTISWQVLVYGLSDGGNFVIGDGNAAIGSGVTFWGSQWASNNTLSGGPAPADFKGFADAPPSAPGCGSSWSTTPGNSAHPPDAVPSYLAIVVAGTVAPDNAKISGDSAEVVIVRTDSGYAPDPGGTGTGTVVGTICP